MFTAFEVFFDNGADKMVVRELVFIEHGRELSKNIMSYRFYLKTGRLYSKYKLQRSPKTISDDLCMDNYESVGRLEWLEVLSSIRLGAIDESIKLTSRLIKHNDTQHNQKYDGIKNPKHTGCPDKRPTHGCPKCLEAMTFPKRAT